MFLIKRTRMETGPISGKPVLSERYWNGSNFSMFEMITRYKSVERAQVMLDKLIATKRAKAEECSIVPEDERLAG